MKNIIKSSSSVKDLLAWKNLLRREQVA